MNVIGTAGHVDHGKSTLVKRLTGIDPDRFAEEKRRGLTIDLGFAWLALPSGAEVGLVDVPGHERFIKNMLAGAGGISVCLFVVAANEGWKPQSAEHLSIIDLLDIRHGVVVITKSDAVGEDELGLVVEDVHDRLAASSLRDAPVVPVSAVTGAGLDGLVATLDRVIADAPPSPDRGRPRLWVDRVFTIAGAGTVVTGTLGGGAFHTDMEVEISPEGRRARIRGIQSHKKGIDEIGPGNRVALNLAGLEREGAERGDAIVQTHTWRPTSLIDVELRVVPSALSGRAHELTEKGSHLMYVGSAETPVRVKLLGTDKVTSGGTAFAQLSLRDPLPVERGDRFVLRDAGRKLTFAGGRVLDPLPHRARRNDAAHIELMERLKEADPEQAIAALADAEGPLSVDEIAARVSIPVAEIDAGTRLGDVVVSPRHREGLLLRMHEALVEHHSSHPLEKGMARELLRTFVGLDAAAFDVLITSEPDVVADGPVVRLATHGVALDPRQQAARDSLVALIEDGGFTPPLAKDLDVDAALLRALVESGDLVKVDGFYLTARQANEVRRRVLAAITDGGPMTVAEIRDLLGTSRKYAVPLCEWLDRTGATRRRGDVRELGPEA